MTFDRVSRRAVLKSLGVSVAVGSVLRVIPVQAAEHAHEAIQAEKSSGPYAPKFFDAHGFKTLQGLSDAIIPPDVDAGGAVEGGAPEFIDLLTSENHEYQETLGDFLKWLDQSCTQRYGKAWVDCEKRQQTEILDLVAYRKNTEQDASLEKAVSGFAFLRNFVADGFFTSRIGIQYLGYKGNTYLTSFPGCPPVPGV